MKTINLRDIYPHYTQDCFVEVTDEVADLFSEFDRKDMPPFPGCRINRRNVFTPISFSA